MLHQGNFSAKNHLQARGKCPRGSRDAPKACSFSMSLVATTTLTAPWGNLLTQRTVAHLNWLRSQSAPLVPKNSKERGSSKDPEHGSAPVAASPRTGRREHPALSKADHPTPSTALGSTCWGVPSPETSLHKLTTPRKGLESPSPPGLDISYLRHLVSGVTQTHSNPRILSSHGRAAFKC